MKIIITHNWHRRDFSATLQCESEACNHVQEHKSCYDDANFYDNVIPDIKCNACKQSANSLGITQEKTELRYPENAIV